MTAEIFGHDYLKKIATLIFDFYCTHSHLENFTEASNNLGLARSPNCFSNTRACLFVVSIIHSCKSALNFSALIGRLASVDQLTLSSVLADRGEVPPSPESLVPP